MHTVKDHADQPNYAYFGDLPEDWIISAAAGRNRDSSLMAESNYDAAYARLESECGPEGMESGWQVLNDSHWACGWVESFAAAPGSKAADILAEIESALADYPILDEADYSVKEYTASLDNITEALRYIGVDDPQASAAEVFRWLDDSEDWQSETESKDDSGAWPCDEALKAAALALGLLPADEDED